MKKNICIFILSCGLVACSNAPKSESSNSQTTKIENKIVSQPKTITLNENEVINTFDNWENTTISLPSDAKFKILGVYDAQNNIISVELMQLTELKKVLAERNMLEDAKIIIKVETSEGEIIDLFLVHTLPTLD